MPATDLETAIADFLALGRRIQAALPVTGQRVLDDLTEAFCRIAFIHTRNDGGDQRRPLRIG